MERPASCKILYLCLMPEIANFWNTIFIGCSKHSIKTSDRPFGGLGMPKVHSLSPNNKRKQCHHTLYSLCSWRSLYIQVKHLSGCHIGFWQRRDWVRAKKKQRGGEPRQMFHLNIWRPPAMGLYVIQLLEILNCLQNWRLNIHVSENSSLCGCYFLHLWGIMGSFSCDFSKSVKIDFCALIQTTAKVSQNASEM